MPNIEDICTRLEIYPKNDVAARLVSDYNGRGFEVIPVYRIFPSTQEAVPNPATVVENMFMLGK